MFYATVLKFKETVNKQAEAILRESIKDVCYAIIEDTPVDTGRLVTNWLLNVNSPIFESTLEVDPTREKSKLRLNRFVETLRFEQLLYFQNNVVYGHRIEYDGWSRYKSPRGMVRINVVNWVSIVEDKKRTLKYGQFRGN